MSDQTEIDKPPIADDVASEGQPAPADPLAEAEARVADYREQLLRVRAESDNLRKRLERDSAQAIRYAAERVFTDLLAVADSLELGLKSARESGAGEAVIEGLELTLRQFLSTLERHGIRVVDPQGAPFDPAHHEAMSMVPSAETPPNHVLGVMQKGYLLHDRLLRPAMVVVASAPPAA